MKPTRESDGASTPRTKLNGSSRSAIYANRSSEPVSYTHTIKSFQQINGRRRQAQNAGAEHMKRASARDTPRGRRVRVRSRSDKSHAVAVQLLHVAQAPVRPRHCTQALLQGCSNQINSYSLVLYRALRRAASVSGDGLPIGFCAPAPDVGDGGVVLPKVVGMMAPKCDAGIGQSFPCDVLDRHHRTFCVSIYWRCWAVAVPCRVYPRNRRIIMGPVPAMHGL